MTERRPRQEAEPTVFVVDDDPAVCDSMRFLLESVGLRVECHVSPTEFLEHFDPLRPGCLVLDVRMPAVGGMDLLATLRERGMEIPVLFLSAHGTVRLAVRAMRAGATDFLEKPVEQQDLLDRIQRALAKDAQSRAGNDGRRRALTRYATLTPRERDVLHLIVEGRANKVIAARLGLSQKTVETHRARVMRKMRVDSLAELVSLAVRWGFTGKPLNGSGKP